MSTYCLMRKKYNYRLKTEAFLVLIILVYAGKENKIFCKIKIVLTLCALYTLVG
jgi:hypothetical protein